MGCIIPVARPLERQMEILMGLMLDLQKENMELRRMVTQFKQTIRAEVEREFEKSASDKLHMISSTLNDVMVQRRIFIDRGFITREEVNKKYEELKAGK